MVPERAVGDDTKRGDGEGPDDQDHGVVYADDQEVRRARPVSPRGQAGADKGARAVRVEVEVAGDEESIDAGKVRQGEEEAGLSIRFYAGTYGEARRSFRARLGG